MGALQRAVRLATPAHGLWRGAVPLAAVALLASAYLLPPLAVVSLWPILYVVPGWTLLTWSRARLTAPARIGLSIVLSVAVSAHAVHWLSLATGGYRRETVFVAALVLALPLAFTFPSAAIRLPAAIARAVRRHRAAIALAAIGSAFVGTVLAVSVWRTTPHGVSSGGFNWSDLLVHVSIAESLNAGNFPPQVPYFSGVPLNYHWFSDFHAAIAARSAGTSSVPAMVVANAVLAGALALLVHGLATRFLADRRAALVAVVLAIFGGGLGYIRFFGDWSAGLGDPLSLLSTTSYDNQWLTGWPYFRIPSVMGTGLLAHRATAAGLPMLVGSLLLLSIGLPSRKELDRGARDRWGVVALAGLLTALLAPFHFFFFPAALALALLYVISARRLFDASTPRYALAYLAPLALAMPFAVGPLLSAAGAGALRFNLWWDSPKQDGPLAIAFFYATNLGVPFILALAAIAARRVPWRGFLFAWLALLFAIPNVASFSHVVFDMNKYFQAMWIAVALLAAWLVRGWPRPAIAGVLSLSVLSPLLVSAWYASSNLQTLTHAELRAADWAARETPHDAVFVTNGWLHSFTDVAGRLRVLTFKPYVANLGYDPDPRELQVFDIYCGGSTARAASLMRTLGAEYVVDATRPMNCLSPTDFASDPEFEVAFETDGLRVWRLASGTG